MSMLGKVTALWAFLALLSLSTATGEVDVIHEEGRCFWSGQCPFDVCGPTESGQNYYLFNNSMAFNVTEENDSELYSLIEEMCPMYIDPDTSIAHVCCTTAMVKSFISHIIKDTQPFISRCPACLKNFIQHYCVVTCDPSGSAFMNGTIKHSIIENETDVQYVYDATFYLTEKYATDLYNSCANVQLGVGGGSVMSLLCGTTHCDPLKFLQFQGNPNLDGNETPFHMRYRLFNNSQPIVDGITPLDDVGVHRFYKCNETVEGLGKCSCLDCPAVSSAPPTFSVSRDPLWISRTSVGGTEKFEPFYRTEQFIVKAKPFVKPPPSFQPVGTVNVTWTFGPVFNRSLLKEVLHVQNHLATMQVEYNDGDGNVTNITLSDICFSPLAPENKNCTIESVLNYFQNDESQLDRTINFYYNYLYHIHYCTRFPFSHNETWSLFNIPCIGAYGGVIDPNVALGGFNKSTHGVDCVIVEYNYDTSTLLIITFVMDSRLPDDSKKVMAWQKAMHSYLHDYRKNKAKLIDIEYLTKV